MKRCGKRKGYRFGSLRREQLDVLKDTKAMVLAQVQAETKPSVSSLPMSIRRVLGFKEAPSIQNGKLMAKGFITARMPFMPTGQVLGRIVKGKLVRAKPKNLIKDSELYRQKPDFRGGSTEQNMVRVGTTEAHKVAFIGDEGKLIVMKRPKSPKFAVVGLSGSIPKDGGQ